jgi:hypothetical protein
MRLGEGDNFNISLRIFAGLSAGIEAVGPGPGRRARRRPARDAGPREGSASSPPAGHESNMAAFPLAHTPIDRRCRPRHDEPGDGPDPREIEYPCPPGPAFQVTVDGSKMTRVQKCMGPRSDFLDAPVDPTPTRARRPFDASVDHTDARKATVRCFGRSDRRARRHPWLHRSDDTDAFLWSASGPKVAKSALMLPHLALT